ncbi:MAG TPA: hypothetical protein VNJ02_07160 [Vicinamibacterales bacterium]|nr:hypothetical protein [Vicinamibacterales bacterium]
MIVALSVWMTLAGQGELIERTLAIVSGQVITLSDVRLAQQLGLLPDIDRSADADTVLAGLIERTLMLREVERYAPPEPADTLVAEELDRVRSRAGSAETFNRTLQANGFTDGRLRGWIRDDLRIRSYLSQRFAVTAAESNRQDLIADWVADLRRRAVVVVLGR